MYLVPNHSKFGYYGTVFQNDWKCQGLDYTAKNVPITYHWLSFPMHLHNELLQCMNDLTTLTDIMKLYKLWDIFYIRRKMKLKSNIYIMAAGSSSPRRQNLLHSAKSTESTEPPAGCYGAIFPHHLLKSLHAARIDQLSNSNEPATIFVVSILESMVWRMHIMLTNLWSECMLHRKNLPKWPLFSLLYTWCTHCKHVTNARCQVMNRPLIFSVKVP